MAKAALAFALLLALRFSLIWLGTYLGLLSCDPQAVAAGQILVWPIGLLSSAFVASSTMPAWLGAIAEANPLSSTVAGRANSSAIPVPPLTAGSPSTRSSWPAIWPLLITTVFMPLAVRRYRRLTD